MSKSIDELSEADVIKKLGQLGLSEKESRVYLALLPRHDVGSSKIIAATGLHGQFVYDALERLEELGLAKHAVQNGRKKFSANTPSRLLSLVEEKRLAAHSIARDLQSRFAGAHEQDFEIFQGESAFVAHEFNLLEEMPEGCTVDVIGGGGNHYVETIGTEMHEYERRRGIRNIKVRYICTVGQAASVHAMAASRKNFEVRTFPNLQTGFVDTSIWPNKIVLYFFGNPLLSFTLTSKEIAASYGQFFDALWQASVE